MYWCEAVHMHARSEAKQRRAQTDRPKRSQQRSQPITRPITHKLSRRLQGTQTGSKDGNGSQFSHIWRPQSGGNPRSVRSVRSHRSRSHRSRDQLRSVRSAINDHSDQRSLRSPITITITTRSRDHGELSCWVTPWIPESPKWSLRVPKMEPPGLQNDSFGYQRRGPAAGAKP